MEFTAAASSSSRMSREGEEEEEEQEMDEEEEEPSPREISFMTPAASPTSVSPSAAASASASASPFRSSDGAGASGSGTADADVEVIDKEHMFDKVVTPSDVGKLNRLVIPKQHAEKYFPLDAAAASDKGLLLSFEDRGAKLWRFRYSYWNSSQSYVMTKGWSRFVKEKRLDAGDTVSFSRGAADATRDRLFIDWKRRADGPHAAGRLARGLPMTAGASPYGPWGAAAAGGFFMPPGPPATLYEHHRLRQGFDFRNVVNAAGPPRPQQVLYFGSSAGLPPHAHMPPPQHQQHPPPMHIAVAPVQPIPAATLAMPMVLDSVPLVNSPTAAAKRVRLFGVNLNNPLQAGESSNDANALSLRMPGWQRPMPFRSLELPQHGSAGAAESSAASSPSSSSSSKREAHSSLDLDL